MRRRLLTTLHTPGTRWWTTRALADELQADAVDVLTELMSMWHDGLVVRTDRAGYRQVGPFRWSITTTGVMALAAAA